MLKVGIDIHGVIDKDPEFFSILTHKLIRNFYQVHIITGVEHTSNIVKQLDNFGVIWTNFFSITSYHKEIKTLMTYKNSDLTQPVIDNELWNITKAHYCCKEKIDIHIDDSKEYEKYFWTINTQYMRYSEQIKSFLELLMVDTNSLKS